MGLSFAIPIDLAMDVGKQLRTSGKVTRGRIGVQAQELSVDLAASFGLKEPNGALVVALEKNGPAEAAGLMPGDVVQTFDGKPVQGSADLARLVASTKPGTAVQLGIWRKGEARTVQVTVAELTPERPTVQGAPQEMPTNRAGLALSELTPQQRKSLRIDHGLVVRKASGAAQRAGIQPGDVLLAINDVPIATLAAFEQQLARTAGESVALLIRRGEDMLYVPLKLERR